MKQLIRKLAGSVPVPEHLRGRDLDEIIEEAKEEHFRDKYRNKKP